MIAIPAARYVSPLRYPGGKARVANYLKVLLIENDLSDIDYVEPYAGGASVALSLLFEEYAGHIHINDINRGVYEFWNCVLSDTERLCRKVRDTALTVEEWQRQREIQRSKTPDSFDLAFSTFFLNRTNRSGIISGGVIGGLDQTGTWKIDARYNRDDLCKRIEKIARFRSRITVTQLDAVDLLLQLARASSSSTFAYLDPPYYVKGEGLYDNFYSHEDHVKISEQVRKLQFPWVVSYDAAPEICTIYPDVRLVKYSVGYSARDRRNGSEVMFFSPGLSIPGDESIVSISGKDVDRARQNYQKLW